MLRNDFFQNSPLMRFGKDNKNFLKKGEFGAVLARAGVGKTALLVQIALTGLLESINVLHVSLNDPIKKVCLWYEEFFRKIAEHYEIDQTGNHLEKILQHRFIMTFKADDFSAKVFENRLADLTEQDIFFPQMILFDGLQFDANITDTIDTLKRLSKNYGIYAWFTIRTHRHESDGHNGLPPQLSPVAENFETLIQLEPKGKDIFIKVLKGSGNDADQPELQLDPSTLLIKGDQPD